MSKNYAGGGGDLPADDFKTFICKKILFTRN